MEKIYQFPDRRVIAEEAVAWLVRLDGDKPPTPAELQAFREWLGRSPVHREEIRSLNAFWSDNILTELVVPLGKSPGPRFWRIRAVLAAAATLVLTVAMVLMTRWIPDPLSETNDLYITAVGQQQNLTLADGSLIQLNTNSLVKVDYNHRYRNVRLLRGEAYFQVAKMPDRPFRVYAGSGRVQAVGTAFTVYLKKRDVDVVVTEGRVVLASLQDPALKKDKTLRQPGSGNAGDNPSRDNPSSDKRETATGETRDRHREGDLTVDPYVKSLTKDFLTLEAGQAATLNLAAGERGAANAAVETVRGIGAADLERRQSWREGLLVFSGEPLKRVIDEVGRYTNVKIELADPALGDIQIGGRYPVGDIDGMLAALETNFGVEITRLGYDRVRISAAP